MDMMTVTCCNWSRRDARRVSSLGGAVVVILLIGCCQPSASLSLDAAAADAVNQNQPFGESSSRTLTQLPPCKVIGREIQHQNQSCVFIASPSQDGAAEDTRGEDAVAAAAATPNDNASESESGSRTRPGSGKDGHMKSKGKGGQDNAPDPYDREGRYWLVPPFLIGASSVIVVYIIMHCIYLHCYAKRKLQQMASRGAHPPHIILSDGDGPSTSSIPLTPVVRYDGSYGTTELVEAQPFLVYHAVDIDALSASPQEQDYPLPPPPRRKSTHLQLPNFFSRKGKPRSSVCSASAALEGASLASDGENRRDVRRTRASICFVPVNRTISDPSGCGVGVGVEADGAEWAQGMMFPSVIMGRNASFSVPRGSVASLSRDNPAQPPGATPGANPATTTPAAAATGAPTQGQYPVIIIPNANPTATPSGESTGACAGAGAGASAGAGAGACAGVAARSNSYKESTLKKRLSTDGDGAEAKLRPKRKTSFREPEVDDREHPVVRIQIGCDD